MPPIPLDAVDNSGSKKLGRNGNGSREKLHLLGSKDNQEEPVVPLNATVKVFLTVTGR